MRSLNDFFVIEDDERKQIQIKINTYKHSQYQIKEEIKSTKKDFTDEKHQCKQAPNSFVKLGV